MSSGVFITFEGIDGVGKTTQLNKVYQKCIELGYSVIKTREPGGTNIGMRIRELLLDPGLDEMAQHTEALLYAADRAQHIQEVIKPALKSGNVVLCDRYLDSSIAYQGYGLDRDIALIKEVNKWAIAGIMPKITFCLDQEPEIALKRTKGDRIEQRTIEYYRKVRAGYRHIAISEPDRFCLIDANGTVEQVFHRIWYIIAGRGIL
ncbi:MAG: dTMP kinase [Firmicutes bacterium]|nr:dTMP kinase [Bacillota bacterium]